MCPVYSGLYVHMHVLGSGGGGLMADIFIEWGRNNEGT